MQGHAGNERSTTDTFPGQGKKKHLGVSDKYQDAALNDSGLDADGKNATFIPPRGSVGKMPWWLMSVPLPGKQGPRHGRATAKNTMSGQ
jgi:hypothetical protein